MASKLTKLADSNTWSEEQRKGVAKYLECSEESRVVLRKRTS